MARGRAWSFCWRMAAGAAAGVVITDRYGGFCRVEGSSMLPTIQAHGDVGLLDRRCLSRYDFSRGDVVVFRPPTDHRLRVVQRLIALPGDWIQIPEKQEIRQVPDGHCWVEGDNAGHSWDSRHYGPVPLGLMEGRITHIIWPPNRIHRVDRMAPRHFFISLGIDIFGYATSGFSSSLYFLMVVSDDIIGYIIFKRQ